MAGVEFEPRAMLAVLERNYVNYVLIGSLAQVIRGADRTTHGVDISPQASSDNRERLRTALDELDVRASDAHGLDFERWFEHEVNEFTTGVGQLKVVFAPAGAGRGFTDLRRAATQEHLGRGLRPLVASSGDLARMAAALHREQDVARLPELRRIMELEADRAQSSVRYNQSVQALRRGATRGGPTIKP